MRRPEPRHREIEQHGIGDIHDAGLEGIAEPDVDDETDYGATDGGTSAEAQATVVELFTDEVNAKVIRIELDTVFRMDCENIAKHFEHCVRAWIALAQQVEIPCGGMWISQPCHQQHCALENETLGMR